MSADEAGVGDGELGKGKKKKKKSAGKTGVKSGAPSAKAGGSKKSGKGSSKTAKSGKSGGDAAGSSKKAGQGRDNKDRDDKKRDGKKRDDKRRPAQGRDDQGGGSGSRSEGGFAARVARWSSDSPLAKMVARQQRSTAKVLDTPSVRKRRREPKPFWPSIDMEAFGAWSERFARFMGTPKFLVQMTVFVVVWLSWNTLAPKVWQFDPRALNYTLLTLILSLQASYAAPLILLAQNRQDDRDRVALEQDRQQTQRAVADTEYMAREVASLRLAVSDLATRDYLRSELREVLDEVRVLTEALQDSVEHDEHDNEHNGDPAGDRAADDGTETDRAETDGTEIGHTETGDTEGHGMEDGGIEGGSSDEVRSGPAGETAPDSSSRSKNRPAQSQDRLDTPQLRKKLRSDSYFTSTDNAAEAPD